MVQIDRGFFRKFPLFRRPAGDAPARCRRPGQIAKGSAGVPKRFMTSIAAWMFIFIPGRAAMVKAASLLMPRGKEVSVHLTLGRPGIRISPDFSGLSFEMKDVLPGRDGRHLFSVRNKPVITLFRTLGIGCLRVGGQHRRSCGCSPACNRGYSQSFQFRPCGACACNLYTAIARPVASAESRTYRRVYYAPVCGFAYGLCLGQRAEFV